MSRDSRPWFVPSRLARAAFALALAMSHPAGAMQWDEQGDAPDLAPGQEVIGVGPLDTIVGTIDPPATDADLYTFAISDPESFSVLVQIGNQDDSQVFLFSAAGLGIAANDDGEPGMFNAYLPPGDPLYATLAAGVYLLGVSAVDTDPFSPGGAIFPATAVGDPVGPTEPGGSQALSGWTPDGLSLLPAGYTVSFTGAAFVPEPGAALLGGAALVTLLGLARRAAAGR